MSTSPLRCDQTEDLVAAEQRCDTELLSPEAVHVPPGLAAPQRNPGRPEPRLLTRFTRDLVRGALVILCLHWFVFQISVVRGHSMEPSLEDGDRLVVDRIVYALSEVRRFDMVVLRYPVDPSVDFVKRVVGLPGDRIALESGQLRLNGALISEEFLHIPDHAAMNETVVPPEHYFVLGDNRPISCDSREFGLVPQENLKGKVRVRFWPPSRMATF